MSFDKQAFSEEAFSDEAFSYEANAFDELAFDDQAFDVDAFALVVTTNLAGVTSETDAALTITGVTQASDTADQSEEADSALPITFQAAAAISAATSARGSDIATANETLTITVDDSSGITAVTVNGVSCTDVALPDGTTVTATVPLGVGIAYGSSVDVVVNNGRLSNGYSVTIQPPSGMTETDFTVDYSSLTAPPYTDANYSAIVAGDSAIYDSLTSPDSATVTFDGSTGEYLVIGSFAVDQTINHFIWDASDNTPSATIEQITVSPGPVTASISQATEASASQSISGVVGVSGIIGLVEESDSPLSVTDGSDVPGSISLVSATESALEITGKTTDIVSISQATEESDSAFPITDGSTVTDAINQASEADVANNVIDITAVLASISQVVETEAALEITYQADLNAIRDKLEALETRILEIETRLDLNASAPNTYAVDGSYIDNNIYRLEKVDNGNGTFTIQRTDK